MNDSTLPQLIQFGREISGDLATAERREWWLSNGRAAYAAGTVAGTLTRRYHGLLLAPLYPPLGRQLLFAKADATLIDGDQQWPLFSNRWGGDTVAPAGHVHLESFHLLGRLPCWRWVIGDRIVEQRIWMEPEVDRTYVAWRLRSSRDISAPLRLSVNLLAALRDHHGVSGVGAIAPRISEQEGGVRIEHEGGAVVSVALQGGQAQIEPLWIENFDLSVERERGLEDRDNHLQVGRAEFTLVPDQWVGLAIGLEEQPPPLDLAAAYSRAEQREQRLLTQALASIPEVESPPPWIQQLMLAADSFIFARPLAEVPDGESVIAGYPWFGDWGRDTMIALPGLTLATGRAESARRILETFARFVDGGMLPNVFPGAGEVPEYNSVDAALWYFQAWHEYLAATGDQAALARAYPVLESIIQGYRDGTRYGIGMDSEDGLIRAGEAGVQLTWMDAKVGDWVVTPRIGKPVEISALWYNALCLMADFARQLGKPAEPFESLAERTRRGFQRFVRDDRLGLWDLLEGASDELRAIRPNQIFAVSLPHSPLDKAVAAEVVQLCGQRLLTSYGLRSLAEAESAYRDHYLGDVWSRDGSYHQGPVWGWLLGHFALAHFRVHGDRAAALALLEPIADHLSDAALGSVSEIFDGAPPHTPRGAPVQAWSVACTLEAWWKLSRSAAS